MSRVVLRSINDHSGLRCLDLVQKGDGGVVWLECRRDPEDSFGWRVIGSSSGQFPDAASALTDARGCVGWLTDKEGTGR